MSTSNFPLQIHRNGDGWVIHQLRAPFFTGTISAWYDGNFTLVEAERKLGNRLFQVKPNAAIWEYVQRRGKVILRAHHAKQIS